MHGINNWREIANSIEGKTSIECRHKFYQINPLIKREKWDFFEDLKLAISVEFFRKRPGNNSNNNILNRN
jgi:hypothetical protein